MNKDVARWTKKRNKNPHKSTLLEEVGLTLLKKITISYTLPLQIAYITYDPVVYSCPKDNYPERTQPYVDQDFLQ